jgi:membrane protease YdiL (CAAX protease family)
MRICWAETFTTLLNMRGAVSIVFAGMSKRKSRWPFFFVQFTAPGIICLFIFRDWLLPQLQEDTPNRF